MSQSKESGSMGIGKAIHDANEFIFVKNKKITSIVSIFVIVGLTFFVFNAEAREKASEMLDAEDIKRLLMGGGDDDLFPEVEDFVERQTQRNVADTISEGESAPVVLINNSMERVLRSIEIDMTWTDESDPPGIPRIRDFENQPDQFTVTVISGNGTTIISESSDTGSISTSYRLEGKELEGSYGAGDFELTVTLVSAGDWVPRRGPGIIQLTDNENAFELTLRMVHLEPETDE